MESSLDDGYCAMRHMSDSDTSVLRIIVCLLQEDCLATAKITAIVLRCSKLCQLHGGGGKNRQTRQILFHKIILTKVSE